MFNILKDNNSTLHFNFKFFLILVISYFSVITEKTKPSKTYPIKTKRTVMINGKPRTIFEGKRGGEYVKKGDGFVKVADAIKAKSKK